MCDMISHKKEHPQKEIIAVFRKETHPEVQ